MFPRKCVDYETCSCACSRTKRRVSALFLTYEDMSMSNFKHMTPCLLHNFPQAQSKQSTTSRLFNLRTLLIMKLFTCKTSPCANCVIEGRVCMQLMTLSYVLSRSACMQFFSHRRMCVYTTCHIISFVCARPTCIHALCRLRNGFMRVFTH